MPPKKRVALSTTVRWGYFDIALLRYLHKLTGKNVNDILREAARRYAEDCKKFDPEEFAEFARGHMMGEVSEPEVRQAFGKEIDTYVAEKQPKPSRRRLFAAKASDFDV